MLEVGSKDLHIRNKSLTTATFLPPLGSSGPASQAHQGLEPPPHRLDSWA